MSLGCFNDSYCFLSACRSVGPPVGMVLFASFGTRHSSVLSKANVAGHNTSVNGLVYEMIPPISWDGNQGKHFNGNPLQTWLANLAASSTRVSCSPPVNVKWLSVWVFLTSLTSVIWLWRAGLWWICCRLRGQAFTIIKDYEPFMTDVRHSRCCWFFSMHFFEFHFFDF